VAIEIQIRRAKPEDAAAIARVLYESFIEYEALYTPEGFAATTPNKKQVLARMQEGPIWVALHEGKVIGTVAAVVKESSVYIRGMAILPAGRGTGTGKKLLDEVESYAASAGRRHLFLSTTPFLNPAIRLYERYGFRRTDAAPHDLFGTPLFTMEKLIAPAD
jgi:N-acetylglutamate synthase-like GNAT family acetyltransferase